MLRYLACPALVTLAACSGQPDAAPEPAITLDAPALIGKDRAGVDGLLGEPVCNQESKGLSCEYGEYTSVFFVDGKAANVTLPRAEDLGVYGLELGEPTFEQGNTTRWETTIDGKKAEVSRFPDFVYVMTFEA